MQFIVTEKTIILRDVSFYYEVYKPLAVREITGVLVFEPTDGLVELMTNVGELLINWDTYLNKGISFSGVHTFEHSSLYCERSVVPVDTLRVTKHIVGDTLKLCVTDGDSRHKAVFVQRATDIVLQSSTFPLPLNYLPE